MQTSSLTLLGVFTLIGLGNVLATPEDCSCLGLANVRKLIPEDAGQARQILYEAWKISQKDFCRSTFQSLPVSSFGLRRRKRIDVDLGTFIKLQAKELKAVASQFFWESWVQNVNIPQDSKQVGSIEILVNQTLEGMERNVEEMIGKMQILSHNIVSEMDEMIPNLDFLAEYDLNSEDVKAALKGLACAWTTDNGRVQIEFGTAFDRAIKTTGVENADVEIAKIWAGKTMRVLIEKVPNRLIKNLMQRFKSLVLGMSPEFENFQDFMFEIQSGKNIKVETIILRILEEVQRDDFLEKIDQGFATACQMRSDLLNNHFQTAIEHLSDLGSQAITGNNKIDLTKLIGLLDSSDQDRDDWIDNLIKPLDMIVQGILEGKLVNNNILPLVLPQSEERTCSEDGQIVAREAKLLTAGALQALLKIFGLM